MTYRESPPRPRPSAYRDRTVTARQEDGMASTTQRILATIGGTLVGAALVVGLAPLHYQGVSCGVAWHGTSAAEAEDLYHAMTGQSGQTSVADGCQAARQPLAVGGGALLVLGVGTLIAGSVARPTR